MYKILQLLIDDFHEKKPNAEYQLMQHKVSEIEKPFIASLTAEQKKEYFKLESVVGELHDKGFDDFAIFLFENLKKYF